jgi:hypothetical protein
MRLEFNRHIHRVIRRIVHDIVESGMMRRLAGAAVHNIGRLTQDEPEHYERIKEAA